MNDLLQLKGRFESRSNHGRPGAPVLPKGKSVKDIHLKNLSDQLEEILNYWSEHTELKGALVSVHYKHVVAKSNRIKILLSERNNPTNQSVRGAKFEWGEDLSNHRIHKHVFTHLVSLEAIKRAIELLKVSADLINEKYSGEITSEISEKIGKKDYVFDKRGISKTNFLKVVVDSFYVERFAVDFASDELFEQAIVSIYETNVETCELLRNYGINLTRDKMLNNTTFRLNSEEISLLLDKAPYLVSMCLSDLSSLSRDDIDFVDSGEDMHSLIPHPSIEPIVGVIDTQFNENVYFHEWVEYKNMLDEDIPLNEEDYKHGTAVSSIIVDGPHGNPKLDDGCGRFRVRHFGVATQGRFSSFSIIKMIREIIKTNRDIKVWNLSLGSVSEIKESFISPEAAELDRLQNEFDVIFIIAGTNIPKEFNEDRPMKIGAPADSLNSIVVNSVSFEKKAASYTRVGPVLSFFHKPDVSYFGGDGDKGITVCRDDLGAANVKGSSYAAPWITRKVAYLIHIMGLSRESAKALLIDAAAGWNRADDCSHTIGYGVVPQNINDIIQTKDDEIRFILSGEVDDFETFTYNIPVPIVNDKYPFYARATLAYFPECDRRQGVDYTCTELDIHFGRVRVDEKKNVPKIEPINNNRQSEDELIVLYEEKARKMYRKWDNVKHISEQIKERKVPKITYGSSLWGLSIKSKDRFSSGNDEKLRFGVVITLKEMSGKNRIDEFIKLCLARGWIVNRLNVQNRIDIYQKAEEELEFE